MRNTGNYLPLVNLVAGGFTFWCRQQLAQRPRSVPDLASSSAAVKNQAAPPLPRVGATQRNLRLLVHYGVGAALGFLRMDPCSFDPCSCNWIALARNCILQDLSSIKKRNQLCADISACDIRSGTFVVNIFHFEPRTVSSPLCQNLYPKLRPRTNLAKP